MTSSAVRGRYEADPIRFSTQIDFYKLLDRSAEVEATFAPTYFVLGPTIKIYRVTDACRTELESQLLSESWWTGWMHRPDLPASADSARPSRAAPDRAQWLRRVYSVYFQKFANDLAYSYLRSADTLSAERLLRIAIQIDPNDAVSAIAYTVCLRRRGSWGEAHQVLSKALSDSSEYAAVLLLQLSRVEAHLKRPARQRDCLLAIQRREPPGSPLRKEADMELRNLAAK